ncbi:sodium-dependent transporter [Planctomycetota bacterium]|nr:sodium-dependent transporter [Planctomycetota bacterium]
MPDLDRPKEYWGTRLGVVFAVAGSAVGLGNFIRFPGLLAKHGGAFMIPYLIAFLLLGLPIVFTEWAIGRYGGRHGYNSPPGIFRIVGKKTNRFFSYLGMFGPLICITVFMFYVFVEAWCLGYAWKYLTNTMPSASSPNFVTDFANPFIGTQPGGNGSLFIDPLNNSLIFLVVCFALNFFLVYRGLSKGIEIFCKFALPTLIICAMIVVVRVLTLPANPDIPNANVMAGLGYMWNPDWEKLAKAQIWIDAAGQIFFSLSIGFGVIITYASYLKAKDDIALSALTAAAGNGFCEVVLGGLMVIPAAVVFLGPEFLQSDAVQSASNFHIGFIALPSVFEQMWAGRWFGFIFFILLFLAAATSSIAMLQPAIAFLEEALDIGRHASIAILLFITLVGTYFVVYYTENQLALETLDIWMSTVSIYMLATIEVLLFGWVMGIKKGHTELMHGAHIRLPKIIMFTLKYISPVYLIAVFGFWIWGDIFQDDELVQSITTSIPAQVVIGLILLTATFILLIITDAFRRWERRSTEGV